MDDEKVQPTIRHDEPHQRATAVDNQSATGACLLLFSSPVTNNHKQTNENSKRKTHTSKFGYSILATILFGKKETERKENKMSVEEKEEKKERVVLLIFAAGPDRFDALGGELCFIKCGCCCCCMYCIHPSFSLSRWCVKSRRREKKQDKGVDAQRHPSVAIDHTYRTGTLNIFEKSFPFFSCLLLGSFTCSRRGERDWWYRVEGFIGLLSNNNFYSFRVPPFPAHSFCLFGFCFSLIFFIISADLIRCALQLREETNN